MFGFKIFELRSVICFGVLCFVNNLDVLFLDYDLVFFKVFNKIDRFFFYWFFKSFVLYSN